MIFPNKLACILSLLAILIKDKMVKPEGIEGYGHAKAYFPIFPFSLTGVIGCGKRQ